jgi:NTP pyrophosphatase (non-canonical NTP hydrolase)
VVNRNDVFQGVLRRAKVMVNELQESIDVKEQNDIASTSSALADIFWTVLGSIFVMGPPTSGKRTDDRT